MPTPVFPLTLQQNFSQEGFSYLKGSTTIRSQNEIGPDKVRRRSTRPIDKMSGSIILKDVSEFSIFNTFYNTTINGGASRFTMNNPTTGTPGEFRFTKDPTIASLGVAFTVTMELEIL